MSTTEWNSEIVRLRAAIEHAEAEAQEAIGRRGAPSGWLGPLIATYAAHARILVLADEYSPELEHGDNGEWAFDAVLNVLSELYPADHHRESCGNHCSCGTVVKTDEQMSAHLADVHCPPADHEPAPEAGASGRGVDSDERDEMACVACGATVLDEGGDETLGWLGGDEGWFCPPCCGGPQLASGRGACPTCGPTSVEQHPRRPGVTRCINCKEWLNPDPTSAEGEVG